MRISIIIPAFNEEKLIGRCLEATARASTAFTLLAWEVEVIVCDNNSTDRTATISHDSGATVVFEPINQIGRARNRGASAATGDWLLFIDADSFPTAELFADMAQVIADGRCAGGGSTLSYGQPGSRGTRVVELWNRLSRIVRWAPGSFLFCLTAAFRELGGFDEELFVSEEIDFSRRLKRWARANGKRVEILHRHPMATSARKFDLYTGREYLSFLARCVLHPSGVKRSRDACPIWYDGRR